MTENNFFDITRRWTVGELTRTVSRLLAPRYGEGEAKAMMRLIFHNLKNWDATALIINSDQPVSEYTVESVNKILSRLVDGEPLQYVLGEARFYGMDMKVSPAVLIPRPETEELVDMIVKENTSPDLRVLDVGTGSGAIAIALSRNLRFPDVTALDISSAALDIARENAEALHAPIRFLKQDVFTYEAPRDSFDIIVSNPPYITESEKKDMDSNVLDHEPAKALFVTDSDPLVYYSRIAETGIRSLAEGGKIYFEINPLFHSEIAALLRSDGYSNVEIIEDISHRPRFAKALKE